MARLGYVPPPPFLGPTLIKDGREVLGTPASFFASTAKLIKREDLGLIKGVVLAEI